MFRSFPVEHMFKNYANSRGPAHRRSARPSHAASPAGQGDAPWHPRTGLPDHRAGLDTRFVPNGPADFLLQEQLAFDARRSERVLVCGHPPLVPTARSFFSRLEYGRTVLDRLADASAPAHRQSEILRVAAPQAGEVDPQVPVPPAS
ncbi:MAG: hypothetical protein AVDCRST_MAG77-1121 [uncultured Chloroflexi bacterium]|uniref:Uncharacterized protein n=1 Tax=uncultured Chloroflexota bacterium TaxID=166587 RepID=A0A6J4HVS9_9CHLR|nr:MAG: hypothetical protein AVDCRST_MAG77-1121 [uncultured Chloroflexota bacterium]